MLFVCRIGSQGILKHPWIVSEAPDVNMGDDYFARIKQLALRQKLKCFFLDSRLEERNQVRRNQLQLLLPFLASSSSNSPAQSSTPASPAKGFGTTNNGGQGIGGTHNHPSNHSLVSSDETSSLQYANSNPSSNNSLHAEGEQMQTKLKQLKDIIIPSLALSFPNADEGLINDMTPEQRMLSRRITTRESFAVDENDRDIFDDDDDDDEDANGAGEGKTGAGAGVDTVKSLPRKVSGSGTPRVKSKTLLKKASSGTSNHRIDYATFESMMVDTGLPELASRSVFKIFDLNHSGELTD